MATFDIDVTLPTDIVRGPDTATDNNVPQWDGTTGKLLKDGLGTSQGGNEASDSGKLAKYSSTGQLAAGVANGAALRGISSSDEGVHGTSATGSALYGNVTGAGAIGLRLTHAGASGDFIRAWNGGADQQFVVDRLGAISWPNGGVGPANTRTNLGLGSAAVEDASAFDAAGSAAAAEAAAIAHADGLVVGLFDDRGNYDASSNLFPATGGSGTAGAILKGDVWRISVAGTLGGEAVDVGDSIRAIADAPGQTAGNWAKFEANVQQATESARGTAMTATLAEVQDPASLNETDIVTPRRMWRALLQTFIIQSEFLSAVRGTLLDGLSLAAGTAITAADSVLVAFGKLQKQITDEIALARNADNLTSGTVANARLDALLAAIGNLTTAADKIIRLTGTDTVDQVDLKLGVSAAYSGTLTWTGTGPTGTANNTQWFTHVGNLVTWRISITYASAGSGITGLTATLPAEFPTPAIPTGFTGANAFIAACHAGRFITTPSGSLTINTNCNLKRNGADNGFEVVAAIASGAYRSVILSGSYHTS